MSHFRFRFTDTDELYVVQAHEKLDAFTIMKRQFPDRGYELVESF